MGGRGHHSHGDHEAMDPLAFLRNAPLGVEGALLLAGGLLLGAALLLAVRWSTRRLLRKALQEAEERRARQEEATLERLKEAFGNLSLEALSRNNELFLQLARESLAQQAQASAQELEGRRRLIDQSIEGLSAQMRRMEELVSAFERDRRQKYGELAEQLRNTAEGTNRLQETTRRLQEALSHSRARGQWGERMAEDVLRAAGFQEGINYRKQTTLEGSGRRPDFTFLLPRGLAVHMDVKFPFENYLAYLDATDEGEKASRKARFLKDVRARVKEITGREYINPDQGTLDYALLFIPNEAVFAFIQEEDPTLMDEALGRRVILCSPLTLFAMLAVIRQAVEVFNLERMTSQVLSQMAAFEKQWGAFVSSMDKVGKRLEEARREFEHLASTRKNQLERPLREIGRLRERRQEGEPAATPDEEETTPDGPSRQADE